MNQRFIFLTLAIIGVAVSIAHFGFGGKSRLAQEAVQLVGETSLAAAKENVSCPRPVGEFLTDDDWLLRAANAAATDPTLALDIARRLLAVEPEDDHARVSTILLALCNAGQFATAQQLAAEAPEDLRTNWLQVAFIRWAQNQPQDAAKSLDAITDPQQHSAAFRAIADGWNQTHPGDLAAYAVALPAGEDRDYAVGLAIDNWSRQDPAALAAWLNQLPRGAEYDYGAAMMLIRTDSKNRTPEVAVNWVETISDTTLKFQSLLFVANDWRKNDPSAAQNYVQSAAWLNDEQREKLLSGWDSQPQKN